MYVELVAPGDAPSMEDGTVDRKRRGAGRSVRLEVRDVVEHSAVDVVHRSVVVAVKQTINLETNHWTWSCMRQYCSMVEQI